MPYGKQKEFVFCKNLPLLKIHLSCLIMRPSIAVPACREFPAVQTTHFQAIAEALREGHMAQIESLRQDFLNFHQAWIRWISFHQMS